MSAPFLDLTVVAGMLADLTPGTVRTLEELAEISLGQRAHAGTLPAVALVPGASRCTGPGGLGNDRMHTEEVVVVISVRAAARAEDAALDTLAAVRAAVWSKLEGQRPAARFSPLRYQGGALLSLNNAVLTYADRYSTDRPAPPV